MTSRIPYSKSVDPSPERFGRGVWASVALHIVLGVLLVTSPALFPAFGDVPWGSESGGGGGLSINLVDASGLPLPAPSMTRPDAVGNQSAGLYAPLEEAAPPPAPDEAVAEAELIPETFEEDATAEPAPSEPEAIAAAPESTPAPAAPASSAPALPVPDNAVPFGEGGQPDIGGFSSGQGAGGIDVGDGSFGERYGRYVNAMRRRIADNWYQSMLNANVPSGSRVTLGFDILRNGLIQDVRIVESSGIAALDTSAERAIYRVRELEPLPPDYRGASINVEFWFEFAR